MYAFLRHLHPPTGIEHSVYCNFFDSEEKNLVVAAVNQLNVYRLNIDIEPSVKGQEKTTDAKGKKSKLESLATFQLFGNIVSMESVRLSGATRDALLVSFRDAKLSMLEYDPGTHDLKTSSLHYFEEDELRGGYCQANYHPPVVRVDPLDRCAAMLVYGKRLVVLPFRRESAVDASDNIMGASKPPIMTSYIIELAKLDEHIINVLDIQFLHGYYEPTIFILYEPLPTWAGRVAVRKDSCSIVAISLNIQQKVHPVIWSLAGLPFDSQKAFPIPKPIGGVLVFAINSLLYLNQSFPPYGVSLNSITDFSTEFLLKPQEGVKISLDCAHACFIANDKLVISLKGGELYVITLMVDMMRAVRSFNLDKAAASVLTTCMCACENGYLFLGSRLGNSLLLKFTEKAKELTDVVVKVEPGTEKSDEPPEKKKKTDTIGDWIATDVSQIDDMDELEVYGSTEQQQSGSQITQYTFEVCDSIMNIGPCSHVLMGEPAFLSEEFSNTVDPDIELVTTAGYSKNGALTVLQRSIRPQVVTTFELPGTLDMWTVIGPEVAKETPKDSESNDTPQEKVESGHALLIMSRQDSTMILQTGQEIMELDHSGFSTQTPTVFACNVGDNKYIIQVSPMGVRLMEGVKQLQHMPLDLGSPIVDCSVADPYIVLMSEEGHLVLLILKPDSAGNSMRLTLNKPQLSQQSARALTLCTYRDISGLFTTEGGKGTKPLDTSTPKPQAAKTSLSHDSSSTDVEDELLYGKSDTKLFSTPVVQVETAKPSKPESTPQEIKPSYWVALARESGVLEIYSLPDFRLCFHIKNFAIGHKVLVDSVQATDVSVKPGTSTEKGVTPEEVPTIKEVLLVGLGNKRTRPFLMVRVDEDLFAYEAYAFLGPSSERRLKLRFKKIQHGLILKEKKLQKAKKKATGEKEAGTEPPKVSRVKLLRPFDDISGYAGVFICGGYPHWLFMGSRGALRIHPMSIDGTVTCFAPFHNINCPKGFLYFNRQGELRISVLPTHLSYDAPWPVRKVPLRCTPHFLAYHPESKTYSIVTSVPEILNRLAKVVGDGEKEFETHEKDEQFIYPTQDKFSIQLFSPVSWEPIPNTRLELDDFEHVTCLKNVNMKSEGTLSGLKGYIALGTNYNYNEEVTSRGRIIIYDVSEVVPEPGQPLTKNKMKVEYDKEQKGPVTALDHVQGFLVTAIGQKIYIWQYKNQDLQGVAFIDTQIYIHSIATIKNMILIADMCKSVSLLRYQEDMKVLSLVSRDVKPSEVYSCGFLVDNTSLSFLVSDRLKNFIVYSYQPEVRESHGGQYLLRRAEICAGSHVNTFFRIRCKLLDPSTGKKATGPVERRHVTYFASLDGSIGYLLPVTEKLYRRLLMLQNALNIQLPHIAGLNPRAYRLIRTEYKILCNPHRNILDGDLLWKYLNLNLMERTDMAKRIGTTAEQIIEDLIEIDRTTAHF